MIGIPLSRLGDGAIEQLLRHKAAIDGIELSDSIIRVAVRLSGGSAYHAQLIGQGLVSRARKAVRAAIAPGDLDEVLRAIIVDGLRLDKSLELMAREFSGNPAGRDVLLRLAHAALADPEDSIRPALFIDEALARYAHSLRAAGTLDGAPNRDGFRFVNAFAPQMLLAMEHISAGPQQTPRQA